MAVKNGRGVMDGPQKVFFVSCGGIFLCGFLHFEAPLPGFLRNKERKN